MEQPDVQLHEKNFVDRLCDQAKTCVKAPLYQDLYFMVVSPCLFAGGVDSRVPIVYHYEAYNN